MSKHYKIHPGIGVARVGKSSEGFFLNADTLDGEPFELSKDGEVPFIGYKDASHLIRRQGARFKVFEYEKDDATGELTFVGEVTPDKATIRWTVTLGNRKASGQLMKSAVRDGVEVIIPDLRLRNKTIPRKDLFAEASLSDITGTNQKFKALNGSIKGEPVELGQLGTDHRGNLVVLAGPGHSMSWTGVEMTEYLNNEGWFDDIADGPIDAELDFPGGGTEPVRPDGAWVMTAPPDFAPGILPFVSLYDLIFEVFVKSERLPHPARVSFEHDIRPVLERAADLRWVNPMPEWEELAAAIIDMKTLADNTAAAETARADVFDIFERGAGSLSRFRLTKPMRDDYFERWKIGDFDSDLGSPPPPSNPARDMDLATLKRCIGMGLFPGIEIGFLATNPTLYSEFGRFTRGEFTDFNGKTTPRPGFATERMAVPWQADFMECVKRWWPVQRPDRALFAEDGTPAPAHPKFRWDRGLFVRSAGDDPVSRKNMVDHFAELGVIDRITNAGGEEVFAEIGRHPDLPEVTPV